ncbi:MAG: M23 family metallopeptidase [Thermoanaerobacteraceae bacterium]|nr:M23 family metallopeptidase [Thermoanaerobacteraceae bacterium]
MYKVPYRGKIRRVGQKNNKNRAALILEQIAGSLLILAILLSLSSIKASFIDNIMGYVKKGLSYDYTIDDGINGIKYVFNQIPVFRDRIVSVFQELGNFDSEQEMILPVDGPITSNFGMRIHPVFNDLRMHQGIDIEAEEGVPVKAALDGTVEKIDVDNELGNYVILKHTDRLKTLYAHLSDITVKIDDKVKQNDIIGKVGTSGIATSPHLHFEVWEDEKAVDPLTVINQEVKK